MPGDDRGLTHSEREKPGKNKVERESSRILIYVFSPREKEGVYITLTLIPKDYGKSKTDMNIVRD